MIKLTALAVVLLITLFRIRYDLFNGVKAMIFGAEGRNRPFGSVEQKVARRYLGAKKKDGGVAIIAWISFICIVLAISAMIIIMSIMNGFRDTVLELTLGSEGHVYVELWEADVDPMVVKDLETRLAGLPEVDTAIEFSEELAGFIANETLRAGRVVGVSSDNLGSFELVANNIKSGSLMGFGQGRGAAHQVAVGAALAAGMGLNVGDRINIMTSRLRNSPSGRVPVMKHYTIGSVFQTGLYDTDNTKIFMELNQSQLLFNSGQKKGEIQLRLFDPDDVDKVKDAIISSIEYPVLVTTWKDRYREQARALRIEQVAMRIIFVIVVIISVFPVLAAMLMLVKNKSRDIAILRTIGSTKYSVLRIFFIAGSIIGILGTLVGLAFGIMFCLNIDVVQGIIEYVIDDELFPPAVYGISGGIPVKIVWTEVMAVALCGFVVSAIATFFPALLASRTDPVEALRYE